ncbi:hypothetical protein PQR02_31915 [Paraburkholderia sediminicola]|uniref:Uncharacterized protein n=1 Tax=Paraburkholderia rhynchosiae TaxID=487049 RepID=A0ACC7NMX6_9BURK
MGARVRHAGHPMPEIAGLTAKLRSAFGDEAVEEALRRGKVGEPTSYASENGRTVGTASPVTGNIWNVDDAVRNRRYCSGCVGLGVGCREWLERKGSKEDS